jgi:glycosyltransferase involved in cell wall biosynthesis
MNEAMPIHRIRVLAVVPAPLNTTPGQRFRIEQWESHLRRKDIEIVYSPFADAELMRVLQRPGRVFFKTLKVIKAWSRRLYEAKRVTGFDLVYVFREGSLIGPAIVERIYMARNIPFVFDFDDAIWIRYTSDSNWFFSHLRCPGKTSALCHLARHVIVGNACLRDYASQRNENVTIIPTTIDTALYRPFDRTPGRIPTVGWTGSHSTERHLEVVRDALERLRNHVEYRLVVVGGGRFRLHGVEVEHRAWRSATETQDLSDFDIGIMPLPDSAWERGKCGLKALQCMALAMPVVVSPVGVNTEIVKHGVNGFLAETSEDWIATLEKLLKDQILRRAIGISARETIENSYSTRKHAPRVAEVFRKVAS